MGPRPYEVGVARDGDEAILLASERTPDLIMLDWMMPKLSGVEVCRRLRRRSETRVTPIIMLTAKGEEDNKIQGLEVGAAAGSQDQDAWGGYGICLHADNSPGA